MTIYKPLNEYLSTNEPLMAKLQMPLKQTKISGSLVSSEKMPGATEDNSLYEAPTKLESEDAPWDPAWPLADELFDCQ